MHFHAPSLIHPSSASPQQLSVIRYNMQTPTYRMGFSSQEPASLQPWSAALSSFHVTGRGSKAPLNAFLCSPVSIGFGDSHSACNFIQPSRCPLMPCALSQRTADLRIRATGLGIGGVQSLDTRMSSLAGVSQIQCWPIRHTCPLKFPHLKLWLLSAFQLCKPLNHKEKEKDASNLQARSEMKSANVPGAPALINEDGQNVTLSSRSETMESSAPVQSLLNGLGSPSAVPQQTLLKDDSMDKDFKPELGPSLCITVIGATGELARSKIFPALFALYYNGCLPKNVSIFGYSRSDLSTEDLRIIISENLTCRVDHREDCGDTTLRFLERVYYQCGGYESSEGMCKLDSLMRQQEGDNEANRIFYLSVPQDVLLEVASCVAANAQSKKGWTRVIVEKPFGHDSESSAISTKGLLANLSEHQIYRIDHLLGKEITENLTVLRFSNLVFEPLWSRTYIRNVQVIVSEDWGLEGRGRYFDKHGIIRDIVQTHIMQTIALFAMEPPVSLDGEDIRNEKVKVLRSMRKPTLHDVVLGQYKASISKDGKSKIPGFLDEVDVSPNSLTPTFVAAVLYIDNARWDGVPFLIKAGIGMIKHRVEIRIQFRHVPGNLYRERLGYNIDLATNELVLRIQPDESILLKINNKVPGLGLQLDSSELNLLYRDKYNSEIPDSYEHLILGVIDGDNKLFIRSDELQATWDLLTPLLEEIEKYKVAPELYQFGGRGPVGAYYLGAMHGVRWADD